jgi:hypothetical protein
MAFCCHVPDRRRAGCAEQMNLRIASRFGTKDLAACCIELSTRGTFTGPFETPEGIIQPTGAKHIRTTGHSGLIGESVPGSVH